MTNVLVVDLPGNCAWLLRAMLRGRRYQVSIATDAETAYDLLETGMYDILVVDLSGPTETTLDVVAYTRELLPGMPVLAVTRPPQTGEASEALAGGLEDELSHGILAAIRTPIDGPRVKQALAMALVQLETKWINRRHDERRVLQLPVLVKLGGVAIPCRSFDISAGGAAVIPVAEDNDQPMPVSLEQVSPPMAATLVLGGSEDVDPMGMVEVPSRIVAVNRFGGGTRPVWHIAFDQANRRSRPANAPVATVTEWLQRAA